MKRGCLIALIFAVAAGARAGECRPGVQLVTIYASAGKAAVPNEVLWRAKYWASRILESAGVSVQWVKGKPPFDDRRTVCGELLTVTFDPGAPAGFGSQTLAYARLDPERSTEIHIFYGRVLALQRISRPDVILGYVLAHEIAHALEGVPRHSSEGIMKAKWSPLDYAEMAFGLLLFAPEDKELIRAHFGARAARAPGVVMVVSEHK